MKEGGDLVSVLSAAEEQFVTSSLDQSYFDLWIGLSTLVKKQRKSCPTSASNPGTFQCIAGSLISSHPCLLRNATRYRVSSNRETLSSAGLMLRRWNTQTGLPTKQQCKSLFNLISVRTCHTVLVRTATAAAAALVSLASSSGFPFQAFEKNFQDFTPKTLAAWLWCKFKR